MAEHFYRSDARAKVAGRARYGIDLAASRMMVGGLLRSPVPRGRITRLDVSAARAMDGVTVITADDLPVARYGMVVADQPPLAGSDVRFAAEPIAAVAAPSADVLAAALRAIVLEIEEEEGIFDLEGAAEKESPLVHPDYENYLLTQPTFQDGNICGRSAIETGSVDEVFASAARVIEGRYETPRVHQGYIEPRSCLASIDENGDYDVHTSTQNPFGVQATLSTILDVPVSRVRVAASTVGGGFGGKLDVTLEHFACLLAERSHHPVKMVCSRREELSAANPRENSVVRIKSALDESGRIIGRDVVCLLDAGAYAHDTPFIASVAVLQATGPYRIDHVRSVALAVYTNTQPTGSYRGPTGPQMSLAVEAHMDDIAGQLGEDAIEFRRRHFFRDGDIALNGQVIKNPSIEQCLDSVLDRIDYRASQAPGRGIGIACGWWTTTAGPTGATVILQNDGTIAVLTGGTEIGSGALATGVVHVAARQFGLPPQRVRLSMGDTSTGVFDFGAQGSRTTFNVGNAVLEACDEVRAKVLEEASHLLESDPRDLELADGVARVRGAPDAAVSLEVVAKSAVQRSGPIHASARYVAPATAHDPSRLNEHHFYPAFNSPSYHCHAAEVAVDEETGKVRILRYVVAQDVGHALVPPAIEGQIQGGVLQGIGLALYEEEILRHGRVANASFDAYTMPTAVEAPDIECVLVEQPSDDGPHGAKGVGEPPIIFPGAAVANALTRATGRAVTSLPMTPDRVLAHLRSARPARATPARTGL